MLRTIDRPTKATFRRCACSVDDLLDPVDVTGEAGHDHWSSGGAEDGVDSRCQRARTP
jgi:hypothetical protein